MDERLRVARREAWRSFWHKLGIVAVALLAYGGLVLLGNEKHLYEKSEKAKWQLNPSTLRKLANTAAPPDKADGRGVKPKTTATEAAGSAVKTDTAATKQAANAVNHTAADAQRPAVADAKTAASPAKTDTAAGGSTSTESSIDVKADADLLRSIAGQLVDAEKVKGTESKPEFVAAVEQLVDERIWRETAAKIRTLAGMQPDEHYLDRIAGEESLARTRIAGLHALIEARATQIEKSQEQHTPLRSMLDEKHPLYVLYEICWYMLLALAVLASSWLLLTLFTVLPFTEAEGYWTKRIGDIIDKFAPGMASAALPLASAGLIAATVFAGTGFATTPGGYARPSTTVRVFDDRSMHLSVQPMGPSQDMQDALESLKIALNEQIGASRDEVVNTVHDRAGSLEEHLQWADERQKNTLACATSADAHAGSAELNAKQATLNAAVAADQTRSVETINSTTQTVAKVIGTPEAPDRSLFRNVDAIDGKLAASSATLAHAKKEVDNQYAESSDARSAWFAQAAVVDERGFFWRTFGRTLFKVGPAAIHSMAAYLNVKLNDKGWPPADDESTEAKLINVLIDAQCLTPMRSGEFREALRKNQPSEVAELMKRYDRQLLHLCALQRN
jgi:hypothetical protein